MLRNNYSAQQLVCFGSRLVSSAILFLEAENPTHYLLHHSLINGIPPDGSSGRISRILGQLNAPPQAPVREQALIELSRRTKKDTEKHRAYSFRRRWTS